MMTNLLVLQDILYGVMVLCNFIILIIILSRAKLFNYYTRMRVIFSLTLGIGLLLDIQPVYLLINKYTARNFAWILSWSFKIIAVTAAVMITIRLSQTAVPWLFSSFIIYFCCVAFLYMGIWGNPENLFHLQAYDITELSLMSLMLGYSALLCLLFTYLVCKSMIRLKHVEERFRSLLGMITGASAGAFFITRLVTIWIAEYRGIDKITQVFFIMSLAWTILPGIVMPFLLNLQNRSFGVKIQALFIWFTYLIRVRRLRMLQKCLDTFCPSLRASFGYIEIFKSPSLCVYQQMIDIFDRKHILCEYLRVLANADIETAKTMQEAYSIPLWNKSEEQNIRGFISCLMQVDDNKPFDHVVDDYKYISETINLRIRYDK